MVKKREFDSDDVIEMLLARLENTVLQFDIVLCDQVDAPSAFVCADSKVYNATEWYICQVTQLSPES